MITIDVIGTLYTPGTYDAQGNELTAPELIPGYHVNASRPVAQWAAKQVTPATPRRVFGGAPTIFYTFDDEAQYEAAAEGIDFGAPAPEDVAARVQAEIVAATQLRLDTFAQSRNYDGILSACTYATSSVPKFAAEGQYCVDARDATWATLYTILGEVLAQTRPMPTGFADIAGDLPTLAWPA